MLANGLTCQGLAVIFSSNDEEAEPVFKRLAEGHVHKFRLNLQELDQFWEGLEWSVRHSLGDTWPTVEQRMLLALS